MTDDTVVDGYDLWLDGKLVSAPRGAANQTLGRYNILPASFEDTTYHKFVLFAVDLTGKQSLAGSLEMNVPLKPSPSPQPDPVYFLQ